MKTSVAVFFGGVSVEHEVSVISAVQAMNSLDGAKYDIVPLYISKQGGMYYHSSFTSMEPFRNLNTLTQTARRVMLVKDSGRVAVMDVEGGLKRRKPICFLDVALPVMHGTNGEDGTIQGYLELLGLPYAGCDVSASALGMNKVLYKQAAQARGVPVLPCVDFSSREWSAREEELVDRLEREIGYPMIVKPVNLGSSVGISKAKNAGELRDAVRLACEFSNRVLAEQAVEHLREINCSVLGDDDGAEASVCEEPLMSDEILSYQDKYLAGEKGAASKGMTSLKRRLPADLPEEMNSLIRQTAVDAFHAAGCSGVVRIDFLLDTAQNKVYVNEINTIPGSLAFYLWEATGLSYTKLLDRLVELALKRQRNRENLMFTYETNILAQAPGFGAKGSKGSL